MKRIFFFVCLAALAAACSENDGPYNPEPTPIPSSGKDVFITCEGTFGSDNGSLSHYDPATKTVENDVFSRANGIPLGDVAFSMTLHGGRGYVAVNNSGAVYAIDPDTYIIKGVIEDLASPRYIFFPNDTTAYISDLYDPHITVIDPRTNHVRNKIDTHGHGSTEQMVQLGNEVFTDCWSMDDKILVIDSRSEQVVDSIEVGLMPNSLVLDKHNKLWTLTDGYNADFSEGQAALYRIDAATRSIEQTYTFPVGDHPSKLTLNGTRDTLYFLNRDVYRMSVSAAALPSAPFFTGDPTSSFYGLGVDPHTSEVYVADAIDYVQPGAVYRLSPKGEPVDTLRVGIVPGSFCFQ